MTMLVENLPNRNEPGVGLSVSMIKDDEYHRVLTKLDDYFSEKSTSFAVVEKFRQLKQLGDENVKAYGVRLMEAVKLCNYQDEDRMLLEQFLRGLREGKMKDRLLVHQYDSYEQALAAADRVEVTIIAAGEKQTTEINYVKKEEVHCFSAESRATLPQTVKD